MKKLSYSVVLFSFLFLFNACDWNGKEDKKCCEELEKVKADLAEKEQDVMFFSNPEYKDIDFCNDDNPLTNKSKYNTKTGVAVLEIIIPKGHDWKRISKNKSSVFYKVKGKEYGGETDTVFDTISDLSNKRGNILSVHVEYIFDKNVCKKITILEKHKGGVVIGSPFHGEN